MKKGVSSHLPETLGGEVWFSLFMIVMATAAIFWGFVNESGRNIFGSILVAVIFIYRLVTRVRKVRLARLLKQNPEIARIYYSTER